jgi:hypothetical protein
MSQLVDPDVSRLRIDDFDKRRTFRKLLADGGELFKCRRFGGPPVSR